MQLDATIRNAGGELKERGSSIDGDKYGFLFRDLRLNRWQPPGAETDADVAEAIALLSERLFGPSGDNLAIPAGYAFFGQFITHDLTFAISPFERDKKSNQRIPRFDLDSVYGRGPEIHPYLYEFADPRLFLTGSNELGELDLPRNLDATLDQGGTGDFDRRRRAVIGDPRNDENTIVSQLHLAFLRLHNLLVQDLPFAKARRIVQWTYQHAVLDFLRRVCGREIVDRALGAGGAPNLVFFHPKPSRVFLPVEFSFAAFRFGHSMLGSTYHLSDALEAERGQRPVDLFADAMSWSERNAYAENTLEGERVLPPRWTVQWDRFVGANAQPSKKIDLELAPPLQLLPLLGVGGRERSLAYRTLFAGWRQRLPSGQQVAELLREKPLPGGPDPLWLYILREAHETEDGQRLGRVGARIVAEVCVGLLAADDDSFYRKEPEWTPWSELGANGSGEFGLEDLLRASGAPVTREQWDEQVPTPPPRPTR